VRAEKKLKAGYPTFTFFPHQAGVRDRSSLALCNPLRALQLSEKKIEARNPKITKIRPA
jgi:hypothetical protein